MKTLLSSAALLLLAVCLASEAVQVKEGDFVFSLESVQKLQELAESASLRERSMPRLASASLASVCADPALPKEFLPLCEQRATLSLSRLAFMPMDVCEICAFAACTGC